VKAPARPAWVRALVVAAILMIVVVGGVVGFRYWLYASAHISTDNATLTGDVVQIAPQVSGTVMQVLVQDNQLVKEGQLLVVLDDANYRANVSQAQANLEAAKAQAEGAGVSVSLTGDTGDAQISQAQAGVSQAGDAIGGAQAEVVRAAAGVQQAKANARSVEANVATAQAQVDAAKAGVRVAEAALVSAKAELGKVARDNQRYQGLFSRGAVSAQVADQAAVGEQTAKAQVESAERQVDASRSRVSAAQAGYLAAKEQYAAAGTGVDQAEAQLQAVKKGTQQAVSRREQAVAQLSQANTAPKQVSLSRSAAAQARAHVSQARAALETARLQLSYTRVYAPVRGRVSKKSVQQGALVQPGLPLMAIVPPPPRNIWVVANYKETQATDIRPGQHAEIRVDGFPGRVFAARVDSVASATGATFALLPPDNATGNFTKVVQRIPVKLTIDPDQPDVDRLRPGMSVSAQVATR
jgi:membrane fusion protein, multidrug efflux system